MFLRSRKIFIYLSLLFILFVMCYKGFAIPKLVPEVSYDTKEIAIPENIIWPRILNPSTKVRTLEFQSRNDFWDVVPPNGKMVEIGVFDCDFCSLNMRNFEKKFTKNEYPTYIAIDILVTPTLRSHIKEWSTVRPNFQFKMGRSDSEEVLNSIDDGSLDVVYIDANHEFNFVRNDIQMWRKKLKAGGLFAGHDYCVNRIERNSKKYKLIAPWCGTYQHNNMGIMPGGEDSDSSQSKSAGMMRLGKEVMTQSRCVDAVVQEIGLGNFSVTFEGKNGLDDDSVTGNPSWYTFL